MSDDLEVSGGGMTRVATTELLTQSQDLHAFAEAIDGCRRRLAAIDTRVTRARLLAADAPISALSAEAALDQADAALNSTACLARMLANALVLAAETYGGAERIAGSFSRSASGVLAYGLGLLAPMMAGPLLPFLFATAMMSAVTPEARRKEAAEWLAANSGGMSDPGFVEFVRLAMMSTDDFGAGFARVPPALAYLLGDEALGVLGLSVSAGVVTSVAGVAGLLREGTVSVTKKREMNHFDAPQTYEDRARRIPTQTEQIRIDRYMMAGAPDRFDVYLGGTKDGSLIAGTEAFDTTSNLHAMALGDPGSYRAVVEAMKAAGVTPDSPIQFNGYSQGGLIAVQLADSGDYAVEGIFTLGGPNGGQPAPNVNHVAVVHNDDVVTALGGVQQNPHVLEVRRTVFDGGRVPNDSVLPAHQLSRYVDTAVLLDESRENSIVSSGSSLREFAAGAHTVETTVWRARRVADAG
jgi:hypothetical protein